MESDMSLPEMLAVLFEGHYVTRRRDAVLNCVMAFIVGLVVGMAIHWRQ